MEKPGTINYDIFLRSRKFSLAILKFCHLIRKAGIEYFLRDQIGRSDTSIGANLHEAKSSSSKKEFCRFYEIALRSCHETMYWLDLINDCYSIEETNKLKSELTELIKIISSIILKIKIKIKEENNKVKN